MGARIHKTTRQGVFGSGTVQVDFEWNGAKLEGDLEEAMVEAMEIILEMAAEESIIWVPVDTGALRDSIEAIGVDVNKTNVVGYFGSNDPDVDYALHQELGTIHFPGHFYLTQAAELVTDEFMPVLGSELRARGWGA